MIASMADTLDVKTRSQQDDVKHPIEKRGCCTAIWRREIEHVLVGRSLLHSLRG